MFEVKTKYQFWQHIIRLQAAAVDLVTAVNCTTTSLLFFLARRADTIICCGCGLFNTLLSSPLLAIVVKDTLTIDCIVYTTMAPYVYLGRELVIACSLTQVREIVAGIFLELRKPCPFVP